MEGSNKLLLLISILTLVLVGFSYIDLKGAIGEAPAELQAVPRTTITMSGVGSNVTFTSGGGNCNRASPNIKAEASISGGAAGNAITVTAQCSLSNWSASTTSTDAGGAAVYSVKTANAGTGAASCTHSYASTAAPDSHWTAVCTF